VKALFASLAEIDQQRAESRKPYREFLRVPAMSAGLYVLAAGATDMQKPHNEDEIYYVVRGRARFRADHDNHKDDREVSAGSVVFVAAKVEHRFYDIAEELAVLVVFAPAESQAAVEAASIKATSPGSSKSLP
jgi:mannose-6-phosphate isomerase-like protein (cupin superfamily)